MKNEELIFSLRTNACLLTILLALSCLREEQWLFIVTFNRSIEHRVKALFSFMFQFIVRKFFSRVILLLYHITKMYREASKNVITIKMFHDSYSASMFSFALVTHIFFLQI